MCNNAIKCFLHILAGSENCNFALSFGVRTFGEHRERCHVVFRLSALSRKPKVITSASDRFLSFCEDVSGYNTQIKILSAGDVCGKYITDHFTMWWCLHFFLPAPSVLD